MRAPFAFLILAFLFSTTGRATTWDEPWMEEVIRAADSLVKARVLEVGPERLRAKTLSHLAGAPVPETFELIGYSRLRYMSRSIDETGFRMKPGGEDYFFLVKSEEEGKYAIATPTTGWAAITPQGVHATYRHSYHKALVPEEVYEPTIAAIFNAVHGVEFERAPVLLFVEKHLSRPPALLGKAGGDPAVAEEFFRQHVALEVFRWLGTPEKLGLIDPFLGADDFHVQISAVRAIARIDTPRTRKLLIEFVEADRVGFAKVMAVWGLERMGAKEFRGRLEAFLEEGEDEKTGFGGNLMDPRTGTRFPGSVKKAVADLLEKWKAADGEDPAPESGK